MSRRGLPTSNVFAQNEQARADYDMAKASRLRRRRTVPAQGSHADYHYRTEGDFLKCMEYARDVMRNDIICSSMVETVDTNTIQDGFTLDFNTGEKSLDRDIPALWRSWANDADACDLAQEHTFTDMESMAFVASLVDGDISGVGTDEGCLQWFEGHRNRTPRGASANVAHGVELKAGRVRESYYFSKEDLSPSISSRAVPTKDGFTNFKTRDENGVRRVFHVYTRTVKRFSQTRGVTALSPMFDFFGLHDDTQFNAAVKQQVLNAILVFRKRNEHYQANGPASPLGPQTTQQDENLQDELVERIGPATAITGKVGEELSAFNSSAPGNEFFPHVKLILTLLGINLGLPLILVLKDASETNFSGWRGAFEQAKMGFRRNQQKMIRRFHDPVLMWKLSQWAAKDAPLSRAIERVIRRHGELNHTWHTPTWPYVQPLDDRNADLIAVANYQDSPSGIAAKNGLDFETVGARCISDRAFMIREAKRTAIAINSEFPQDEFKVNWRELYTSPTPATVSTINPTEVNTATPIAGGPKNAS